jgi:sugar phosphate isomerase/epimerase
MRLSAITDEISPDLDTALRTCESLDIATVELRFVGEENVVRQEESSWRRIRSALDAGGFRCAAIDTPFLKTPLSEVDWTDLELGLAAAAAFDAPLVRVFSGLRVDDRAGALSQAADILAAAARRCSAAGRWLVLEIEFVCNVATSDEAVELLALLPSGVLGLVWDPGNESRFHGRPTDPTEVSTLTEHIWHVHVKDVDTGGAWLPAGAGIVDWAGQLAALQTAGYQGCLSLETHYELPQGGAAAATAQAAAALRTLAVQAGIELT